MSLDFFSYHIFFSANTGFYFVRQNPRTRRFFNSVLLNADMIFQTFSHQQVLIAVLNEHVSLHGLRVKIYARDTEEFPGGFQWNQPSKIYMRRYFAGEVEPWIFHMSWTLNKNNKVLYFEQFGEWWVQEKCIQNKAVGSMPDVPGSCCLAEPKFECHYRDKPSKLPCKDSPPIDKGKPSFWKWAWSWPWRTITRYIRAHTVARYLLQASFSSLHTTMYTCGLKFWQYRLSPNLKIESLVRQYCVSSFVIVLYIRWMDLSFPNSAK